MKVYVSLFGNIYFIYDSVNSHNFIDICNDFNVFFYFKSRSCGQSILIVLSYHCYLKLDQQM